MKPFIKKWSNIFLLVLFVALIFSAVVECRKGMSKRAWVNRLPGGRLYLYHNPDVYFDYDPDNDYIYASTPVYITNGSFVLPILEIDLPTATTSQYVSDIQISTSVLDGATSTFSETDSRVLQGGVPMNLSAFLYYPYGKQGYAQSTETVSATLTIHGLNSIGKTFTETVTVSTTPAASNIGISTIAYISIGSLTTNSLESPIALWAGYGLKYGLPCDIRNGSDIMKVTEDGTNKTGYLTNTTYDTITFENSADGSIDFRVWINANKK